MVLPTSDSSYCDHVGYIYITFNQFISVRRSGLCKNINKRPVNCIECMYSSQTRRSRGTDFDQYCQRKLVFMRRNFRWKFNLQTTWQVKINELQQTKNTLQLVNSPMTFLYLKRFTIATAELLNASKADLKKMYNYRHLNNMVTMDTQWQDMTLSIKLNQGHCWWHVCFIPCHRYLEVLTISNLILNLSSETTQKSYR